MLASVRNALFATFALAAVACTAPGSEEEVSDGEGDLASALSRGDAPVADAAFIPSSDLEVGSWVAYAVGSGARTPAEMVFVNHAETGAAIVVSVNVATNEVKVLGAPPDGSGAPLMQALLQDLAAYDTSSSSGSIHTQGLGTEAAKRLLAKAATRLKVSGDDLVAAIQNYTGSGYQTLNRFLREGTVPTSWTKETLTQQNRTLTQALRRLPAVEGESRRWMTVGVGAEPAVNRQKLTRMLEAVKPGGVFRDRGFLSTTLADTPPGVSGIANFQFNIKGKTGRDISMLSYFPTEQEVLFAPGTRFRVASVKGEFVDRGNTYVGGVTADQWNDFVTVSSQYFPGVTKQTLDAQLNAGKIPKIIVALEEIAAR